MHKAFISYHHANDQQYKDKLVEIGKSHRIFLDASVDTGDISDDLSDEAIRQKIRDEYLRDSTVTIVLVGTETRKRKHVDWEVFSSMFDGTVNKKSGVLAVHLPQTNCTHFTATHDGEKATVYPENTEWINIHSREEYERRYPYLPARIIDNLLKSGAKVSVTNWSRIENKPEVLEFLVNATFNDRAECDYDLSRSMRRSNS